MTAKLPNGWQEKEIQEVAQIYLGLTHTPSYKEQGVPFLSVKDMSAGKISFENTKFISEEEYNALPKGAKPRKGDVLFARVGTLGCPSIVEVDNKFGIFVSLGFFRVNNNGVLNTYIRYWMLSPYFWRQVDKNVQGSTLKNLNTGWLKYFKVNIPTLSEQKRIVEKLDKIFAAIDKAKSQTEKNLQNAKDVFSSYLNNIFNHPAHSWKEKTLGEVCEIISGTTPDTKCPQYWGGENYWITPAELTEGKIFIDSCRRKITDLAVRDCSLRPMPKGTVVFSSRAPIGKVAINNLEVLYCNQGFKNFICSQSLDNKFLFYFLKFNTPLLVSLGHGTTFKEISKTTISKVSIRYPSLLEEQKQIVKKLDILKSKTQELEKIYTQKLADLEELKQSVLQQAFNGKL
ncbi:restriction endonuclease subunit S [Candidatus Avelusimicrobium fimicolum]|uniref:restriction endonuclease subunit S n=1 Tax=Candidatus Avelusimicrobium fimicolum TaxID=3416216 RepID=UPI003D0A0BAB